VANRDGEGPETRKTCEQALHRHQPEQILGGCGQQPLGAGGEPERKGDQRRGERDQRRRVPWRNAGHAEGDGEDRPSQGSQQEQQVTRQSARPEAGQGFMGDERDAEAHD
jgi:hypothetical protein